MRLMTSQYEISGKNLAFNLTYCNNNKVDTMIRYLESTSFLFFFRDHLRSTLEITCGLGIICGTVQC